VALARTFLDQPIQIRAEHGTETPRTDHIEQFAYRAHAMDKAELLARVLQVRDRGLTLIFTRTKRTAAKVADDLAARGFAAAAVHGDLGQGAREQALRAFRSGKVDVLVATDVAARGWDVEGISHVVNYQAPEDEMIYVHRIGRTARAGKPGKAITLVDWDDVPRWKLICDQLDLPLHEPAETYSTSEHLYLELDIPADATGVLPRTARTRAGLAAEQLEDLGGPDSRARRNGSRDRDRGASGRARAGGERRGAGGERREAGSGRKDSEPGTRRDRRPRKRTRRGQASSGADAATPATGRPAGSSTS
jgi:superfamily II DNA/RNA helicase